MKKSLLALLLISIASLGYCGPIDTSGYPALITSDDVTMNWLNNFRAGTVNSLNSFPGENIQSTTITADSMVNNANPEIRWGEAFNEFVYTGLLPATGTRAAAVISAGTAYIKDDTTTRMTRVVKDSITPGSTNYPATKDTYVDLSTVGAYTYQSVAVGAAAPVVAANSIRLAKVITNATDVTSVVDMRILGVQLSTNEDFDIKGFELYWSTESIVSVDAGLVYNSTTRINKTSATTLNVGTASDYAGGASERGTSKFIHVYVDNSGNIKLDDTTPDYHSASAATIVGKKYYYLLSGSYWRYIGSIYLDATGSGEVTKFYQDGDFFSYDPPIQISTTVSNSAWRTQSVAAAVPPTSKRALFGISSADGVGSAPNVWMRPWGGIGSISVEDGLTAGATTIFIGGELICMIGQSQSVQYQQDANDSGLELSVKGYWIETRD